MVKAEKVCFTAGRKDFCKSCAYFARSKAFTNMWNEECKSKLQTTHFERQWKCKTAKHDLHPFAVCHLGRTHREARSRAWVSLFSACLYCRVSFSITCPNSQVLRCRWSNWRPRAKNLEETQPTESLFTDRGIHDRKYSIHVWIHAFSNIFLNERICQDLLIWRVWLIEVPEGWSRSLANDFPNSWQIGWELGDLGMPATLPVTSILM